MSMRSCARPSSPTAHIAFCTLDEVLRPQILSMRLSFLPSAIRSGRAPGARITVALMAPRPVAVRAIGLRPNATRRGSGTAAAVQASFQPARFLRQHDRNHVANGIGKLGLARDQLLPFGVVFERALRQRTDENLQQFRIDAARGTFGGRRGGHGRLPGHSATGIVKRGDRGYGYWSFDSLTAFFLASSISVIAIRTSARVFRSGASRRACFSAVP